MIDTAKEYIVCAAIHYNDGKEHVHQPINIKSGFVTLGLGHHYCVYLFSMIMQGIHNDAYYKLENECVFGFLTSRRRFVEREEAGQIAIACGQIEKMEYFGGKKLDSSDLYK
jgi:hypothetical protein